MVMKPTQKDLQDGEVVEKSNKCYFCGAEVDEAFARYTEAHLGKTVCSKCLVKIVTVISFAGKEGTYDAS